MREKKSNVEIKQTKDFEGRLQESCRNFYDITSEDYALKHSDELDRKPSDKEFLTRFTSLLPKNASVLDIGCCSAAQQARFLKDVGCKVTSIDISSKCIEIVTQKYLGITFKQMDMLNMDFEKASFDAIVAFYSIIHIPDEKLGGLLDDFSKVLKPNGKIAVTVHIGEYHDYYEKDGLEVFFRTFDPDKLASTFNSHGFRVIDLEIRKPVSEIELPEDRIYLLAEKA